MIRILSTVPVPGSARLYLEPVLRLVEVVPVPGLIILYLESVLRLGEVMDVVGGPVPLAIVTLKYRAIVNKENLIHCIYRFCNFG